MLLMIYYTRAIEIENAQKCNDIPEKANTFLHSPEYFQMWDLIVREASVFFFSTHAKTFLEAEERILVTNCRRAE